jgi:HlyD family secretion protein
MIRILLVDDQNIIRQGIQALLESKPKLKVVGTAEDGNSAIEQVENLRPDVVLIDIEMPAMSGIAATHIICQQFPQTKVIILSSHENQKYVAQALQAGAEGYLLKNILAEDLEQAIWSVYRGHSQIESKLLKVLSGAFVSPSIMLVEQNKSTSVVKQSGQKTSCRLHSNTSDVPDDNNKYLQKIKENTENSHDRLRSKTSETKLAFEQSESRIKNPPDGNRDRSEINDSPIKQANKEPLVQQDLTKQKQKRFSGFTWLGIVATLISISIIGYSFFRFLPQRAVKQAEPASNKVAYPVVKQPKPTSNGAVQSIVALGYLEPNQDGAIQITAPSTGNRAVVDELLVKQGDHVKNGQVIATLSTRNVEQAAVKTAETQVEIAQTQLAQVRAGNQQGDIQAQAAMVASAESQLDNARTEYQRYELLSQQGAVPAQELDSRRLQLQTSKANLRQKQEQLRSVAEVRPEDVQTAKAQLINAIAQLNEAKANLELTSVRASRAGEVIQINTYPGELIDDNGILELGQTSQMYVSAEIYQSDINRVRLGQKARITGDAFEGKLLGTVNQIGREVKGQSVEDSDPLADVDARVIKVKIRLTPTDSQKVAGLTNLQVKAEIIP